MKIHSLPTWLRSSLCMTALVSTSFAAAATPDDQAARMLATHGAIAIDSAGRYIQAGTYRVQVAAKLGQPDVKLVDGTWLYHHRKIDGSSARGTLVVRFAGHSVSELSLVTPKVAAALSAPPAKTTAPELLATK